MATYYVGKGGNDASDDYIVADPISGTRILFRQKYGDPARYIFRVVCYEHRVRRKA
jgi:hypothetical protein